MARTKQTARRPDPNPRAPVRMPISKPISKPKAEKAEKVAGKQKSRGGKLGFDKKLSKEMYEEFVKCKKSGLIHAEPVLMDGDGYAYDGDDEWTSLASITCKKLGDLWGRTTSKIMQESLTAQEKCAAEVSRTKSGYQSDIYVVHNH